MKTNTIKEYLNKNTPNEEALAYNPNWYRKEQNLRGVKAFLPNELVIVENTTYTKDNKINNIYSPYRIFQNKQRLIKYLENHKRGFLFETLPHSITKAYYDLDKLGEKNGEKDTLGISREELNKKIKRLIFNFNFYFNKNITSDDVLVYVRKEEDPNIFKSVHLIIKNIKIHKEMNKHFIQHMMNESSNFVFEINKMIIEEIKKDEENKIEKDENLINILNREDYKNYITDYSNNADFTEIDNKIKNDTREEVDSKVYKSYKTRSIQNFCLPFNTKNLETHHNREFIPFNKNTQKAQIEDYLIGVVDNCEMAQFSEIMEILNEYDTNKKDSIPIEERIEPNAQPNPKDIDTIKLNQYNILDKLKELLPVEFYNDSILWTKIVINLNLYNFDIEFFLTKNLSNWTEEQNREFIEKENSKKQKNIDTRNPNGIIYNVIAPLNKAYNLKLHYKPKNDWDTIRLRRWIQKITNLSPTEVNVIFKEKTPSSNTIFMNFGENWIFYTKMMELRNTETNESFNFWFDEYYKNYDAPIKQTNEEILVEFKPFMNEEDERIIFNINALYASGKTYTFINLAIDIALKQKWKILVLTENNILNGSFKTTLTNRLKEQFPNENYLVAHHQPLNGKKNAKFSNDSDVDICSLESVGKLDEDKKYDLIILDEFESLCNHFESSTFEYITAYDAIKTLEPHLLSAKKIINLDADLSVSRLQPLYDILKIDEEVKIHYSNVNKWREKEYVIDLMFKKNEMINFIYNDIDEDKKLALSFAEKTTAQSIEIVIRNKYPTKNILCIWSGTYLHNGRIIDDEKEKNYIRLNVEEFILKNKIDIWFYTPSVKTGLSVNKQEYFHKTYMFSTNKSCVSREIGQMLFRVRDLIDKRIIILIPKMGNIILEEPTRERVEKHLLGNITIQYLDTTQNYHSHKIEFEASPLYKSVKISNLLEEWNKKFMFSHSLYKSIKQNMDIDINIIYEEKTTFGKIHTAVQQANNKVKFSKINNLETADLLPIKTKYQLNLEREKKPVYHYNLQQTNAINKRKMFNNSGISKFHTKYDYCHFGKMDIYVETINNEKRLITLYKDKNNNYWSEEKECLENDSYENKIYNTDNIKQINHKRVLNNIERIYNRGTETIGFGENSKYIGVDKNNNHTEHDQEWEDYLMEQSKKEFDGIDASSEAPKDEYREYLEENYDKVKQAIKYENNGFYYKVIEWKEYPFYRKITDTAFSIDEFIKSQNRSNTLIYNLLGGRNPEIQNIKFNNFTKTNNGEEPAINNQNKRYIKYNFNKRILAPIIKELYNEDGTINFNNQEIKVNDYTKRIKENQDLIRKEFPSLELIKEMKDKFKWDTFDSNNTKHMKTLYTLIQSSLKSYGMTLIAPKNKSNKYKNPKYKLTRNTKKVNDIDIKFIHKESNPVKMENINMTSHFDYSVIKKVVKVNGDKSIYSVNKNKPHIKILQEYREQHTSIKKEDEKKIEIRHNYNKLNKMIDNHIKNQKDNKQIDEVLQLYPRHFNSWNLKDGTKTEKILLKPYPRFSSEFYKDTITKSFDELEPNINLCNGLVSVIKSNMSDLEKEKQEKLKHILTKTFHNEEYEEIYSDLIPIEQLQDILLLKTYHYNINFERHYSKFRVGEIDESPNDSLYYYPLRHNKKEDDTITGYSLLDDENELEIPYVGNTDDDSSSMDY